MRFSKFRHILLNGVLSLYFLSSSTTALPAAVELAPDISNSLNEAPRLKSTLSTIGDGISVSHKARAFQEHGDILSKRGFDTPTNQRNFVLVLTSQGKSTKVSWQVDFYVSSYNEKEITMAFWLSSYSGFQNVYIDVPKFHTVVSSPDVFYGVAHFDLKGVYAGILWEVRFNGLIGATSGQLVYQQMEPKNGPRLWIRGFQIPDSLISWTFDGGLIA